MNSKQTTVMWMGLTLVILRFFTGSQWKAVWGTVLQGQPASPSGWISGLFNGIFTSTGSSGNSGSTGSGNGITTLPNAPAKSPPSNSGTISI